MVPVGGFAQESAPPVFRQEELDQMLAPIALYPDSLINTGAYGCYLSP